MKESSRKDFAYAMTPMKIVSWPVGTWPLQNYGIFSAMRGIIVISLVLLMLAILQMEIYLDSGDAGKTVDALILITSGVVALSKIIWFRIRPGGLISNFTSAVKDYEELEGQDKRLIVRRHAYIGRVASASVIFSSYIGSTLYMTIPMLAGDEEKDIVNVTEESTTDYPIPSECVMAVIQLPDNLYFMVFIIEYLMLIFTSTGNLGSDSLLFGIIFHLCGQVEILKLEFNKLSNENERTMEHFIVLIKRHIYLLNLAKMLNETISFVLVVQLFTSCILICTTGFQFILELSIGNIVMAMKTFIVMSCLLVQLFAYSYVGEYLKRQMESVGDSVYFCSWYHVPKNIAKGIVFVIMRSQDPVSLKAGKFFIVNMETYMNILKTSMSYLSVLRVMVNPDGIHDSVELFVDLHLARMKASSRKDFAYAMTPLKIVSWPVGTWPLQDYDIFSAMRGTIVIFLMLLMLMIVQTEMYFDRSDAEKNLDALLLIACGILAVSKIMWFRIRPAGLISNFTSAVKDYNDLEDQEKRAIMRMHAYMGRVVSGSVIIFAYVATVLFMIVPVLADVEEEDIFNVTEESVPDYPMPSEYVMELIKMPDNLYFIVFIIECLMRLLVSTGNLGSDSLFFGITFHLCGQVEILKLDFNRLGNENERTMEHFIVLIKRHIYLLNLAKMLNETISSILVVQLFASCILICTTGFQFILDLSVGNIVMAIKTFIVLSTLLVQLFAYSYVGEYLKLQMEGVGDSVYFCSWYDIPTSMAKDIIYIIMKSQDPVSLKAGKFFIVNMETYMSILKTSMSYLSVLRVMVNA
ncbi:uncharacterized protein LOC132912060 [Bombus pascuorum]|uniref:uncharacterized protein LOC132912060 n=1 Tax=Bombus pascuorum TaxID=65598 RepID=UPI00298DCE2D|nr:uncharacterized protein LOC132912060 [Bombus pascuorum]